MLYTVGHEHSYELYLDQQGEDCEKLGRDAPRAKEQGYLGGCAFETLKEAYAYAKTLSPYYEYRPYGLVTDLSNTYQIEGESFRRIIDNCQIVRLEDGTDTNR